MAVAKQAYISYVHGDGTDMSYMFAGMLAECLENNGVPVFRDSEGLRYGNDWQYIRREAQNSSVVVLVISRRYVTRYWCMSELDWAVRAKLDGRKDITIIPVLLDTRFKELPKWELDWQDELDATHSSDTAGQLIDQWKEDVQYLSENAQAARFAEFLGDDPLLSLVDEVALRVFQQLPPAYRISIDGAIGLDDRVDKVIDLLKTKAKDMIGIVGAGEVS